jgi:hypothetical protein
VQAVRDYKGAIQHSGLTGEDVTMFPEAYSSLVHEMVVMCNYERYDDALGLLGRVLERQLRAERGYQGLAILPLHALM